MSDFDGLDQTDLEFEQNKPERSRSQRKFIIPNFKKQVVHTGLKGPSYKIFKREMDRRFNKLYDEKLRQHPMHPEN